MSRAEELARRIEHLVELERVLARWYLNEDTRPYGFPVSDVIEWAQAHDFSMLELELKGEAHVKVRVQEIRGFPFPPPVPDRSQ